MARLIVPRVARGTRARVIDVDSLGVEIVPCKRQAGETVSADFSKCSRPGYIKYIMGLVMVKDLPDIAAPKYRYWLEPRNIVNP